MNKPIDNHTSSGDLINDLMQTDQPLDEKYKISILDRVGSALMFPEELDPPIKQRLISCITSLKVHEVSINIQTLFNRIYLPYHTYEVERRLKSLSPYLSNLVDIPEKMRLDCLEYFEEKKINEPQQLEAFFQKSSAEKEREIQEHWDSIPLHVGEISLTSFRGTERKTICQILQSLPEEDRQPAFEAIRIWHASSPVSKFDLFSGMIKGLLIAFKAANRDVSLIPFYTKICKQYPFLFAFEFGSANYWSKMLEAGGFFSQPPHLIKAILEAALNSGSVRMLIKYYDDPQNLSLHYGLMVLKVLKEKGYPNEWIHNQLKQSPYIKNHPEHKLDIMHCFERSASAAEFIFLYSMGGYDEEALNLQFPFDYSRDTISAYIVRKVGFADTFLYGDQDKFGSYLHQSIQIGAHKGWDFDQLCVFYAYRRFKIAAIQGTQKPDSFGLPREAGPYISTETICGPEGYNQLGLDLKRKLQRESSPFVKALEGDYPCYQLKAPLGGEQINHCRIGIGLNMVAIHHTDDLSTINKMIAHARQIYNEALEEENPEKVVEKAGLIYWWLCQAKPYSRGDPSIFEMLIKTLFLKKKIPIQPWRQGIVPWEMVMKEFDPQAFAKTFFTLFDKYDFHGLQSSRSNAPEAQTQSRP